MDGDKFVPMHITGIIESAKHGARGCGLLCFHMDLGVLKAPYQSIETGQLCF